MIDEINLAITEINNEGCFISSLKTEAELEILTQTVRKMLGRTDVMFSINADGTGLVFIENSMWF